MRTSDNYTVIGIEDEEGKAYAKVYNYWGQTAVGQYVYIEATVSPANFEKGRINQCQLLLDDGKIVSKIENRDMEEKIQRIIR